MNSVGPSFQTTAASSPSLIAKPKDTGETAVSVETFNSQAQEIESLKQQVADLAALARNSQVAPKTFAQLAPSERAEIQHKLDVLDKKSRLFRQKEPNGPLVKAGPSDVVNSLDRHIGLVWIVEGVGHRDKGQSSSASAAGDYAYARTSANNASSAYGSYGSYAFAAEASRTITTDYAGSPLLAWEDLELISTDAPGLPGLNTLPKPVGSTQTGYAATAEIFATTGDSEVKRNNWDKWNL